MDRNFTCLCIYIDSKCIPGVEIALRAYLINKRVCVCRCYVGFSFRNREHCEGLNYVINDSYD